MKVCNNQNCLDTYGEKTHQKYDPSLLRCPRCGELLELSPIAEEQREGPFARFYTKYLLVWWCLIGLCAASVIYLRPSVIEDKGIFLCLVATLLAAAPVGFMLLFIAVVMRITVTMFVEGANNRDIEAFIGALYLLVLLIMFVASLYGPSL